MSEDDISKLEELLAAKDSDDEPEPVPTVEPAKTCPSFLEDVVENEVNVLNTKKKELTNNRSTVVETTVPVVKNSVVHAGDTDSSDDEEKRNCLERRYDDYGSAVKNILNTNEKNRSSFLREYSDKSSHNPRLSSVKKSGSQSSAKSPSPVVQSSDVYSDPIFGLRIVNPLISGSVLTERMRDRMAVSMYLVKKHVSCGDMSKDWVIAGVIVRKSSTKESQKGSQYCIWTLSDLKGDLKTVSVFLFRNAYKQLWKTAEGTVVGILNPSVLDKRDDSNDEACLSVDNAEKVMVLGRSKDLGYCKSKKRNGDPCTSFVNSDQCQYCVYHVKQEYQKCSKRSDLQASNSNRGLQGLRNKVLGKDTVFYAGKSFTSTPASKSKKLEAADKNRLQSLGDYFKNASQDKLLINKAPARTPNKKLASQIDVNRSQRVKDLKRLEFLRASASENVGDFENSPVVLEKCSPKLQSKLVLQKSSPENGLSTSPSIGIGLKRASTVDLNVSYGEKRSNRAKLDAIKWIKEHGPINKKNPNNTRGTIEGKKRILENNTHSSNDVDGSEQPSKKLKTGVLSENFQKILQATSTHANLVVQHENAEQDKYFNKLEIKEAMEEKMLNTFKVACKAVKCLKCSYVSFSAAQNCKDNKHPLKVFDTFKRFFRCSNCGNRTTCLNIIPLHACKNCQSSKWERAAMINERKGVTIADKLSIRGEEEKFLGSVVHNGANVNLLVPED